MITDKIEPWIRVGVVGCNLFSFCSRNDTLNFFSVFYLFSLFKVSSKQESQFSHMCKYAFHILLRIRTNLLKICVSLVSVTPRVDEARLCQRSGFGK